MKPTGSVVVCANDASLMEGSSSAATAMRRIDAFVFIGFFGVWILGMWKGSGFGGFLGVKISNPIAWRGNNFIENTGKITLSKRSIFLPLSATRIDTKIYALLGPHLKRTLAIAGASAFIRT
jgi:hypothetical protein